MADYSSSSIPPPKDWQAFERCCRTLFECILEDPLTQLNGRTGQSQHGVDVYGRRGGDGGPWVGIQCKGKEGTTYGKKVTEKELRNEVKKAFHFIPKLSEFILATTAPNDSQIQLEARLITEENEKGGNPMTVAVWGWGELENRIAEYPQALRAFHPDLTPFTDEILSGQAKIATKLETGLETIITQLEQIKTTNLAVLGNTTGSSANDQSELEAQLHRDIDTYRDLIVRGQPDTGKIALQALFAQFEQSPFPLAIFADLLGIDVIKAWQGMIETRKNFRVCMGTAEERDIASNAIARNSGNGCVTDALTFYIIRRLGLENTIVEMCGRIGLTESSVDVFRQRQEEIKFHGGKPFLVMSFQNGQYFREEITAERLLTALNEVQGDLLWIDKNCDILPAESDLGLTPTFRNISKRFGGNLFDSILAADGSHRILLCEDYQYRLSATQNGKLTATWLQPVLMMAQDKSIISPKKYDDAVYYMLECGFEYISVNPGNLLRTANLETDLDGKKFKKMAEAIGGPSAEIKSHIGVAVSFLREIWEEYDPPLKSKAQTGKVLECLLRGRKEDFWEIIRALLFYIPISRQFREYFKKWLKGHFYLPS